MVTHIFIQNNARRHQQLAKIGNINSACLHLGKVDARLLEKFYAILGKHVIRKLELPIGQANFDIRTGLMSAATCMRTFWCDEDESSAKDCFTPEVELPYTELSPTDWELAVSICKGQTELYKLQHVYVAPVKGQFVCLSESKN